MRTSSQGLACWQHLGQWFVGGQPDLSLHITSIADWPRLQAEVAAWLEIHPGAQAVGLINYHAGEALAGVASNYRNHLPMAVIHCYSPEQLHAGDFTECLDLLAAASANARLTAPFVSRMSQSDYLRRVTRIQDYLLAGDAYQVNFARQFSAQMNSDPLSVWIRLARAHPAPHACYVPHDEGAVFGVSPERFLRIEEKQITSEPIKGSRPRLNNPQEDAAMAQALLASGKDRAENLMIVDLMRNDLGKVCQTGSVETSSLFELRRFSNVQHLVSTVTGQLREGISPLDALLACFPGGSITGAPKKRAMEIIAELETAARHFYCGSQFSIDADQNLDSSILIRTFQYRDGQLICHGGGGIVADSDPQAEYQESAFKVEALMASLSVLES